jgi:hypothetical protein
LFKDSTCTYNYPSTQDTVIISSNQPYTIYAQYNSCCMALFQYNNVQLVWFRNNVIIDTTSLADAYASGANYLTPFTISIPGTYRVAFICCQNPNQMCREVIVIYERSEPTPIKPGLTVPPNCNIYPNPSTDRTFNVSSSVNYTSLEVYNSSGQKVKILEEKSDGNIKITLPEFSEGIYIVRIVYGSETVTKKVLVSSGE